MDVFTRNGGPVPSSRVRRLSFQAVLVGVTLFLLILVVAPFTSASLNPARSIGPAFASGHLEGLQVYFIGPLSGGAIEGFWPEGEYIVKRFLFVCVENAGRSQMAEAFAKQYGRGRVIAESAGTMPGREVNPIVLQVMKEKGIDLSRVHPKMMDLNRAKEADVIVTMGCSVEGMCPAPLLKNTIDWNLEDPKGKSVEKVREIRDDIERKVKLLLSTL